MKSKSFEGRIQVRRRKRSAQAGALVYIGAFLAGLFARTAFAELNGWENYTMDGHDLVCGLLCIVMIWAAKGTFFPSRPVRRKEGRR